MNAWYRKFLITASIVLGLGGFAAIVSSVGLIIATNLADGEPDLNIIALSIAGMTFALLGFDRARRCRVPEAAGWLVTALLALILWAVLIDAAVIPPG